MELKVTKQGSATIVSPAGQVDGRAAFQFEQDALELLQGGSRHVVVDMSAVTLLASAGIRVLILMLHKLEARDGILVLCGLNHYVRTVLEVSGLSGQFTIVATTAAAVACLPTAAVGEDSEPAVLARRVLRLLSIGAPKRAPGSTAAPLPESTAQQLAARVRQALTRAPASRR